MIKKLAAALLILASAFVMGACDPLGSRTKVEAADEWAVYWYLCGSDLESAAGLATDDIIEMSGVNLPKGVKVVIQAGGTTEWWNDTMDAEKTERYLYSSDGFELLEQLDVANMGKSKTLSDFLTFCRDNYPAKRTMLLFWNHGGGSVSGVAFDENYGYDSLSLNEIYTALSNVYPMSAKDPAFELVGFDTCLMATVDTADKLKEVSRYMVASQELEPGSGWAYDKWIGALAENPSMNGEELGKTICDSFYSDCKQKGYGGEATLSLTDLSKAEALMEAYKAFGDEALLSACEDARFVTYFARVAIGTENYGGNTGEQGYTNMLDLGHMARQYEGNLDSARAVSEALSQCVIYNVKGAYRSQATGLSFYYPYSGDPKDFNKFTGISSAEGIEHLYHYGLNGQLSGEGLKYVEGWDIKKPPALLALSDTDWEGKSLKVNEDGYAYLDLGPEADSILTGISFSLYYTDPVTGGIMWLGRDNDMDADWVNGVFTDNFRGVWGAFGGKIVYMELSFEGEDYNIYAVPVLLNGERYNLEVVYDFNSDRWSIQGARKPVDENGFSDKNLISLKPGDEIGLLWYWAEAHDDEFKPHTSATLRYAKDMEFAEEELPDGVYTMVFEMRDSAGNFAYSNLVDFIINGEDISTEVY